MIDTTVNNLIINKLTKELYDAIQYKSDTELYLIPDEIDTAPTSGSSNPVTSNGIYTALLDKLDVIDAQHKLSADLVDDSATTNKFTNATEKQAWNNKQDALVSGTNIKTVNNTSLLDSGNIDTSEVFWATYRVTTYQQVADAVNAGKIVFAIKDNRLYMLRDRNTTSSLIFFFNVTDQVLDTISINDTNVWRNYYFTSEIVGNRVSAWQSTPQNTKYPSEKLVYDSLYKRGVVSQTQTWTGSTAAGFDYTMSNLVYGNIPIANIDLFVSAGATFNAATGYFELNGLTDISYEEMQKIYVETIDFLTFKQDRGYSFYNKGGNVARTLLPFPNTFTQTLGAVDFTWAFYSTNFEVIPMNTFVKSLSQTFRVTFRAKNLGRINVSGLTSSGMLSNAFFAACSVESIDLYGLKYDVSFSGSPRLSVASILYMIQNEASTSAITITLHPTAYARAIADSDVQAALQSHTNVTLASA